MIETIRKVGINKAINFGLYKFVNLFYKILFFHPLQILFLRSLGGKINKNVVLVNVNFFNMHYNGFNKLKIGKNCFIGEEVLIDLADSVILGDNVTLGPRVTLLTHMIVGLGKHPLKKIFPDKTSPLIIENNCFIGANTTILSGVTIGEGSVIGAGSLINKNVPKGSVAVGSPFRVLRRLK